MSDEIGNPDVPKQPLATVNVSIGQGDEPGSLRIRQEGTGNVLLRFEALIAAAGQLLETAMLATAARPEKITGPFVTETLAAYIGGELDENAETMVTVSLDALTPRPPVDDADEPAEDEDDAE
ncbi:MAG: hypothetical protein H7338_20905 [Candidatus Sericytochromatia bacterium]|nr:hypothetical protein [Candidatus Sericytochromatia bacterium]